MIRHFIDTICQQLHHFTVNNPEWKRSAQIVWQWDPQQLHLQKKEPAHASSPAVCQLFPPEGLK